MRSENIKNLFAVAIAGIIILVVIIDELWLARACKRPIPTYNVTYVAHLKTGGWEIGELVFTAEKLNKAAIFNIREWIETNRTDTLNNQVYIISMVKLDD